MTLAPEAVKDRSTVTANNSKGTETSADAKADAADDADALTPPTVEQDPAHQGGIIVKPVADADKVTVKYTDEKDNDHTVTVTKDPASGQWSGTGLPEGVSVDPATGTVTLAPEAVKDRSTVTANNSKGSETSVDATAQAAANVADSQVWLEGDSSVNEGSEATYTVKLEQPADKEVTVKVKVTHVSTTDGDISYTVNTITIAKGEREATFKITATDDATIEANESYRVEIGEATGATVDRTRSSVTTEIVDNDLLNPPTVAEGDAQGSVVITPAEGADKVVVRFNDEAKQPHTATVSKNPATGEWTIDSPITGVNVDPATGKVTLTPSAVEDGSDVTAMNSVGTRNSDPATVKAGNNSNEPEISINGSTEVKEGETATYTVSLNKTANTDVAVTVTLTHKGTDDADFTQPPVSKTVTIPAGETSAQFTLDVAKDGKFEGSEGYTLTLSNPQGAVLGQTSVETKVTDIDPPSAPTVEDGSEQGSVVVTPANGTDKLVVNFNNEAKEPQTVTVGKDPATGEWSSKEPLPQGVTVDPKTGVVTIGATAVEDGGDVKAIASAGDTNSPEGTGKAGNNGTAPSEPTLTISGDETVGEGQAATYTIRLSEARTEETTVTVTLTHKETSDADFDASAQPLVKTLTIPAGQTEAKLTLNTADDSEAEGKETFTIGLSNPSSGVKLGDVTEVTTAINDNDSAPGTAEVKSVSSPSVGEGEDLIFDVAVDKPAADTEVSLTLKGGTATLGTDTGAPIEVSTDGGTNYGWTVVTPDSKGRFTVTIPAGSEKGVKVRVPTMKDGEKESNETVTLDAAAAGQRTPLTGTGTITDVDAPASNAKVNSVSNTRNAEGQDMVFLVGMDKQPTDTKINLTLKGGTATLGTDTVMPIEVSTDDGDTWKFVTPDSEGRFTAIVPARSERGVRVRLMLRRDNEFDDDETLTLEAAADGQTPPIIGKGIIYDVLPIPEQGAEVKSVSSPSASEGQDLVFDVAMEKLTANTEVTLTLKGGTATLGADTGTPVEVSTDGGINWRAVTPDSEGKFTVVVPALSENGIKVRVPTMQDGETEVNETLTLQAVSQDQTTPISGTGTIIDADAPAPSAASVKSVSSPSAGEGQDLVFDVAMDKPVTDTEVSLVLKGGTATLGTDTGAAVEISTDGGTNWTTITPDSDGKFTATVPAGSENGVKVRVTTIIDSETEAAETLTLQAAAKGQAVPATGTGTITDAAPAPSAEVKSVSSPKAAEGEALVFEVAMDKPTTDTEVSLTLKGGTATLGTDTGSPIEISTDGGTTWTPVTPGSEGKFTATVPAGSENGVKVRVPAVTDTETEADETLTLDAATAGQITPATGTGTITDVPPAAPQAPSVAAGTEQGSVTVTPPATADKLTVTYKDEDNTDREVVVNKDPASGEWKGTDLPEGVTVDAKTGVVTLAAKAVLDNSEVKAVAAAGTLSSDAGSVTAGEDGINNMTGNATSEAIAADKVGLSGEYYGYNDDSIDRLVQNNPKVAANVRYHADDKTSGVNLNNNNNLYDLDFTERMINGRNGSKVTGEIKSAAEGTPDARFTVTDINYGGKAAVSSGLANNEKTAVGQGLSQSSALRNFLDVNGAEDADSARVEAGAPYKGTSGLGYTTDAAVRIVGHVYFGEGTYDFKFALDNGATVRIDGKDIYKGYSISEADTLGKHPNGIHLTEGVHSVEIIYLEEGSVSTLHMQYKAHGAADSSYQTMGLDNNLMLKPEASLDLNQLQDVHNTGTANNPAWHVRTGATLDGGEGKDDITGSEGRDFIYGHGGNDSLTGGKGGDTFIYNTKAANGHDVIKDFKIGEDKIALTDLLDTKSIDAKTPGWKGLSEIQNAQWDDSAHKLSFDTTDGVKTYHNSITFEGMTQHYSSVDDFLRENGNGII